MRYDLIFSLNQRYSQISDCLNHSLAAYPLFVLNIDLANIKFRQFKHIIILSQHTQTKVRYKMPESRSNAVMTYEISTSKEAANSFIYSEIHLSSL
jgi:hypothetical protein